MGIDAYGTFSRCVCREHDTHGLVWRLVEDYCRPSKQPYRNMKTRSCVGHRSCHPTESDVQQSNTLALADCPAPPSSFIGLESPVPLAAARTLDHRSRMLKQ